MSASARFGELRRDSPRLACLAEAGLRITLKQASEGWSGRRGSNPRPTAWKAVTLPLSYSRLRARPPEARSHFTEASSAFALRSLTLALEPGDLACAKIQCPSAELRSVHPAGKRSHFRICRRPPLRFALRRDSLRWLAEPKLECTRLGNPAKAGGEGRIRTSEAARATDLQSAAFDRSATSPALTERRPRRQTRAVLHESGRSFVVLGKRCFLVLTRRSPNPLRLELAEGFEPPTG